MLSLFYFASFHWFLCTAVTLDMDSSLPTIDTSLCNSRESYDIRMKCYYAIHEALKEYGTFVAINHGIESSFFSESFSNAETLFKLDVKNKLNVSMSSFQDDFGRGYIPFGEEAGVSSYYEIKEGYSYGFPREDSENFVRNNPMESLNRWPSQLDKLTVKKLESVFLKKIQVVKIILDAIIAVERERREGEGVDDSHATGSDLLNALTKTDNNKQKSAFNIGTGREERVKVEEVEERERRDEREEGVSNDGDSISLMRLFHYFSAADNQRDHTDEKSVYKKDVDNDNKTDENDFKTTGKTDERNEKTIGKPDKINIGSSPHTDWGLLTVIMQDETGGLQFLHNNIWKDVPVVPHGLVINGGDYLNMISNGLYHSPIHRVLCPPNGKERISFVFFYYPGYYSKIFYNSHGSKENKGNEVLQVQKVQNEVVNGGYNTLLSININGEINNESESDERNEKQNENNREYSIGNQNEGVNNSGVGPKIPTFGDYILRKWKGVAVQIPT